MNASALHHDAFAAAAAQRAQQVMRDVKTALAAPAADPQRVIQHYSDGGTYGGSGHRQTDDYFTMGFGDTVQEHKLTARDGRVLEHSIERYHETGRDVGDHSELVSMATRNMSRVTSRLCGFLAGLGCHVHSGNRVVYTQQRDHWTAERLSSHRDLERVSVYADGVTYERQDDNGKIKLFIPGLQLED